MPRRIAKRKKRFLGSRNCGGGNVKNRRGSGCRGGKGMYAGSHKHRWTYIIKYEPDHFGRHGFSPINPKEDFETINVGEIYALAKAGRLEKKGDMFVLEFEGKVLGSGEIALPVSVKAISFSEGAKAKIEKASGKCESAAAKNPYNPAEKKKE